MKCKITHELIVAAAYGELTDEQAQELELHLASCPECGKEREQLLALKTLAGAYPVAEPEANLVARSRLRGRRLWTRCHRAVGMDGWASG